MARRESKADRQERIGGLISERRCLRDGRTIEGARFEPGDRVASNGQGILATPEGVAGTVIARYPTTIWDWGADPDKRQCPEDMGLEWSYSVRWDDRDWNNPGNRPAGCGHEMLQPLQDANRLPASSTTPKEGT